MCSTARPRGRPFEGQTGPQGVTHCRHTGGSGGGSGGSGGTCDDGRGGFSGCVCRGECGTNGGDGATATRRRGRWCGWLGCVFSFLYSSGSAPFSRRWLGSGRGRRGGRHQRAARGGRDTRTRARSRVPRPLLEAQHHHHLVLLCAELLPAAAARWHDASSMRRRRRSSNCARLLPLLLDSTLRATRVHERICARRRGSLGLAQFQDGRYSAPKKSSSQVWPRLQNLTEATHMPQHFPAHFTNRVKG